MGKVTNDEPLVHGLLALDADAGAAAKGAVGVVCVGAVDAELDGVRGRVDGGVAVGQGAGKVLIACGRDDRSVRAIRHRRVEIRSFGQEYSPNEAIRRIRNGHKVEAIYQSLSGVRNRQ